MSSQTRGAFDLPKPFDVLARQLAPRVDPRPLSIEFADPVEDAGHLWSPEEVLAITQAWASARPLLIRGEAGCGKSQLAAALSQVLGVPLFTEVIQPRFEPTELLYKVDHVRRLAEAQLLGAVGARVLGPKHEDQGGETGAHAVRDFVDRHLPEGRFVDPGVLLQAFDAQTPVAHQDEPLWPRAVVLIDEVDKADSDLPNALLGVLGERRFTVPGRDQGVTCTLHRPLVLVTTNEDRELPAAFVRRCAVLNIKPPKERDAFVNWMVARARTHRGLARLDGPDPSGASQTSLFVAAAQQVWADRESADAAGYPTVGLAEFIDLLYALFNVSRGDSAAAWPWLERLSAFALVKQKDQDQSRAVGTQA